MTVTAKKKKKTRLNVKNLLILLVILLGVAGIILCFLSLALNSCTGNDFRRSSVLSASDTKVYTDPVHEQYGPLADISIELKFGDNTEKLTLTELKNWVDIDNSEGRYSYTVDNEKLEAYVKGLAEKYDTFTPYITFRNSMGEDILVENRSTGWIFDSSYAYSILESYITEAESLSMDLTDRSPASKKWWTRVSSEYGIEKKMGDCYAEVNIELQYMWIYKNGECVLRSLIVTGNPNTGHDTPKGAFLVYNKQKGATLYGPGYMTEVAYWVGFADDIGFHDATWQTAFGGDRYLTNGSHGCVNLPLDTAEQVFDLSYVNMPVYVY